MKSELINHKLRTTVSGLVGRSACYRRRILVMVVMLAVLASVSLNGAQLQPVLAQADTWTTRAAMPTPRRGLGAAAIDSKLYAVGGINNLGAYTNALEVYDPVSNSWTTKDPMPTPRYEPGAAAIDGKLYVVGGVQGINYFNALEVYDPVSNSWTTKDPMPTPRYALGAAAIDGKLYVVGGIQGDSYLNALEVYDPVSDTWTTKTAMPTSRAGVGAAAIDGKLYVVGGTDGGGRSFNTLEVYDPVSDSWTTKAPMPASRYGQGAAAIDGKLYVVGGIRGSSILNALEVYDSVSNSWTTKTAMPTSRYTLGTAAIDGMFYVVGGSNGNPLNKLEVYEPNTAPVVACKDVTVSAGSGCTATITTDDVNNGSYDPDAGDNISLSLSPSGPFSIGQHTVTLTATDSRGASSSCTATVTVADTTAPVLDTPDDVVVYLPPNTTDNGMAVSYTTPTATDCSDVTITTSKASGTVFPVGTTTVSVTATDAANNESSGSFTVTVLYNFSNYLPPIDNLPAVNIVKAGSAIPVKFSLSGYKGMAILAAGFPTSQALTCGGGLLSEIAETVTAGASSLSYDATTDVYIYVWKTDRAWAGTCRQLIVKLKDGTIHTANFQFR